MGITAAMYVLKSLRESRRADSLSAQQAHALQEDDRNAIRRDMSRTYGRSAWRTSISGDDLSGWSTHG